MQYTISGKVIKGDGYGRKIGFPTVNLDAKIKETLKDGVYSGTAKLEEKIYNAGIVIGPKDKIEAYLIGYNGNAYDKEVTLQINKFLREYKNFETEKELITQIEKDLKLC